MMKDDEDTPEAPIVTAALEEAQATIKRVATLLQLAGWDAIVVSVSRAIETAPGHWQAPGATVSLIDPSCNPITPQIVAVLRKQADTLEASSPEKVADNGYIHDQTDYASGMREWPE
jgi:hypothetical protein